MPAKLFFIISLNIRSFSNSLNFSKLEAFVHNLNPKPDIIAVTETWIHNNLLGPYCNLSDYVFISNSRKIVKGGGVGFYVKRCHKFTVIDEMTKMHEKAFESIFIKIELLNNTVCCGNVYRSPLNDNNPNKIFLDNLEECFQNSRESLNICIITGNLNYDLLNLGNTHVSNFVELMHENYYFPVINKPTHFSDSSATVIDHIWTNLHSHQIKSGAILDPLSDHLPVYICIDFTKHGLSNPKQKRFFTPHNLTKFNEMLKNIDIPLLTYSYHIDIHQNSMKC